MPLYRYKASDLDGKTVRGELQAQNKAALSEQLLSKQLYLTSYAEKNEKSDFKKLSAKQLSEFCRELGMLLGASVPLVRALSIMGKRDIPDNIKDVYSELYRSLRQGSMLSAAMEAMPGVFPELLVSMLRASEDSGAMEQTCLKMAEHYQKSYKLNKKVKSAMTYPIILIIVTILVLLAVFLFILPTFFEMFEDMDAELPGITRFMLGLSQLLRDHWLLLGIGVLAIVLLAQVLLQIPAARLVRDRMRLKYPVVGKLLKIIYTARFARTLSSCYASGVSIVSSLRNARDTIGNSYIISQFSSVLTDVRNGKALSAAIKRVDGFDTKLSSSIQIGEETGKLYDMLESTADTFDYEADIATERLTAVIEPVMIVVLALVIGTVIVSVMLPMITLYDAIGMSGGA